MGWVKVDDDKENNADWVSWDEEGTELEGTWRGKFVSRHGNNCGRLQLSPGRTVAFSLPTVLNSKLEHVSSGVSIKIHYIDQKRGSEGYHYKDFDVFIEE